MSMLSFFFLLAHFLSNCLSDSIPSSCINLEDGYHWIKLLDDDIYPVINVLCDNEYIILDVNHDKNIKLYFQTFYDYHYALSGADHQTSVNWKQWFIPSSIYDDNDNTNYGSFITSSDCSTCGIINGGVDEAYYMTGTMYGCLTTHKAERDCSWDWNTYSCNYCTMFESDSDLGYHVFNENDNKDDYDYWWNKYLENIDKDDSWMYYQVGLCGVHKLKSNTNQIAQNRDDCFSFNNVYNPSIGNDGRYCQCYKPPNTATNIQVPSNILNKYKSSLIMEQVAHEQVEDESSISDTYKLYQRDFISGTYRILSPGTYLIMEDIEFNFNAGDLNNPNINGGWWPLQSQSSSYPGAYDTRDEYFMGFFSGITVESNDVIIDLNNHEIRQSLPFYYQQRFFSIISLKSFIFNLNQGPGIFGTKPIYPSNVIIRNGIIGLSSHHGIHGVGNQNLLIENINIRNFETHGIQLSDFNNIRLNNIDIGPSSSIAYLNGEYAYSRFTLQRLERIRDNPSKQSVNYDNIFPFSFSGRNEIINNINDIINPLREQMDIAFKYVMNIDQSLLYNPNDSIYKSALKLYVNKEGIPYGAVMYGLFLNLYFANVFAIHPSLKHSANAEISNIFIHDLKHSTREYLRLDKFSITPYANPYNAALDAESILGSSILKYGYFNIPWNTVSYHGDVLIDAHITLDLITSDWGEKGLMVIGSEFISWALNTGYQWSTESDYTHPFLGCNGDRMTHSAKGLMGIRIDGVDNINFNNLNISNLYELSPLGSFLCTNYWEGNMENFFGTGHFLQNTPYLYGYTGNMMHGIFADFGEFTISGDSSINNLYSNTGIVRGIGAYTSVNINIYNNLNIYKLGAGIDLLNINTNNLKHPYAHSIAKPFHIINEWIKYENKFYSNININDNTNINIQCLYGKDGIQNDLISNDINSELLIDNCYNEENQEFEWIIINNNKQQLKLSTILFILSTILLIIIILLKKYFTINKNNYGAI